MCVSMGRTSPLAWLYKETGIYLRNHFKMGRATSQLRKRERNRTFQMKLYLEPQYINQIKAELFGLK